MGFGPGCIDIVLSPYEMPAQSALEPAHGAVAKTSAGDHPR
jgi:hypothetical protein